MLLHQAEMADSQFADLGVPLPLFVIGLQLTQILYQLAPFVLIKGSGTLFKRGSHEKLSGNETSVCI